MPVSFVGRIMALGQWLCAAETLGSAPPGTPPADSPGPGLCDYFLREGHLPPPPDAPPAEPTVAARPTFLGWLLAPEGLPTQDAIPTPEHSPRAEGARHPRAES
jgi:hypothetical protein